ncbi:uncharacterized protein LOC132057642 [Lycium ferocissimum]|uniref:uncharacterized protein LOC132057642 n=1 Tax=Lycium ferocissimum TaxID=112874 RepID=UPI002815DEB5|nr:uncharacterized protein LOC132057642 [Lycium ferocissimum]
MASVWNKLKKVKTALKSLHTTEFRGIETKVQQVRQKLKDIQEKMRYSHTASALFTAEKEIRQQLEKWVVVEESIYKQKSRANWLRLGDSNTTYFHAYMKSRYSQNMIRSLVNAQGVYITSDQGIEEEIQGFYRGLLGSTSPSLPAINPDIMKQGNILTKEQQLLLVAPITFEEIYSGLCGIDDSKAPGRADVTDAVKQLFDTSDMYKAINVTSVTLVPKATKSDGFLSG